MREGLDNMDAINFFFSMHTHAPTIHICNFTGQCPFHTLQRHWAEPACCIAASELVSMYEDCADTTFIVWAVPVAFLSTTNMKALPHATHFEPECPRCINILQLYV